MTQCQKSHAQIGLRSNIAIARRAVNLYNHNAREVAGKELQGFSHKLTKYYDLKSNILIACLCICVANSEAETYGSYLFVLTISIKNLSSRNTTEVIVWFPRVEFSM